MRARLTALAAVAAVAPLVIAAATAPLPARPLAASAIDDCPPGYGGTLDTGLDGGPGCRKLGEEEGLAKLTAPRTAAAGARSTGESGVDRLAAYRYAERMRRDAEADAARAGRSDLATRGGVVVPGSGAAWRSLGPEPLNYDDPTYPQSQLGLGKVSGRVSAISIDRTDPSGDTVYVGTAGGGVWKTTDAGATWASVGDTIPTQSIGALTVDERSGWVFVGTGESNTGTDNYAGLGVFRSRDGGATWEHSPGVPADTVISFIAVSNPNVFVATSQGLYRSTNMGESFALAPLPTGGSEPGTTFLQNFVTDVRVQPNHPEVVTAAVGWRSGGVEGAGLYRSTDGGETFTKMNPVVYGQGSLTADKFGRTTLAYPVDPEQDENVLWAVVQDPGKMNNENNPLGQRLPAPVPGKVPFTTLNGVYRSGDNGATWELKATYETLVASPGSSYVPTFTASQAGPGVQSWYNQYIFVDPTNQGRVLLGLEELFQTASNADVPGTPPWQVVGRYFNTCAPVRVECPIYDGLTIHPDQHAIDMVALPDGRVRAYVGNDGGMYKQDADPSGGLSNSNWESLNENMSTLQFHAAIMADDGVVYGGMQDNGTMKLLPNGYGVEVYGGDGFDVAVDPKNSELVFAETQNGALRRSSDGGVTWSTITPTGSARPQFFTPFEMDPRDPEHLVFGTGQIWETTEASSVAAGTWKQVMDLGDPMSANAVDVEGDAVYVAFCGECNASPNLAEGGEWDPSIFTGGIATNVQKGCKRESGSSECWHVAAGKGLPKRYIGGISIDPNDPETLYAAVSSYRRRWLYQPEAYDLGGIVYVSHDAGETWRDLTGNLPRTFGADVVVDRNRLIVATDIGVFANTGKDSTEWVPFGTGLPAGVPAYDLSIADKGRKLVLATHGRGIYVMDLRGTGGGGQPPRVDPPKPPRVDPPKRPLPATGSPAWLVVGPLVAAAALVVRRRLRRA